MKYPTNGKPLFRREPPRSNLYRVLLLILLVLGMTWVLRQLESGRFKPALLPTPTPTRSAASYVAEAEAWFAAGKLDDPNSENDAIGAYIQATRIDPNNPAVWAELARIQTYSTTLISADTETRARLQEALASARQAVALAPDDSTAYAVLAFALDWNATSNLVTKDERQAYLNEAETAAVRSLQLDPDNVIALAYYAEVLLDQQNWDQARQYAEQAVARAPNSMDAHRVYGTVLEGLSFYRDAISEFQKASELAPNLTFLYLRIGLGYRNLGAQLSLTNTAAAKTLYDQALDYFDRAATINERLGVKDPLPYIAIAKVYTQEGEFFIASRNAEKALAYSPANADTYGQLGSIYVQSRNYESALPTLRCAVEGCSAEENETAQILVDEGLLEQPTAVQALPLTSLTVAYYYIRYGSVLAYLSDPQNGYCDKAYSLMAQLRANFDDAVLLENAAEVEDTCRLLQGTPMP